MSPDSPPQEIRFCTAPDGTGLAFATHGSGPALVRAATWLTHLEHDWESPVWRHWLAELGAGRTMVRYDERGCGLSDRSVEHLGLDTWVADLEAVVDAAGLERFALLGMSQGGPVSIAYAARHPERVSQLILYGTSARGRRRRGPEATAQADLLIDVIRHGWEQPNPAFRRTFTTLFVPEGTREQLAWFDDLQMRSCDAETAVALRLAREQVDVTEVLAQVTVPTLVLHARDDAVVPFAEGRLVASGIDGARFVPLEGRNHILLEDEPAWPRFVAEVRAFAGAPAAPAVVPDAGVEELSAREAEVLALVAGGASNEQIAAALVVSVRTVERHLTNVYAKLGLSGKAARAAAAARYARSGA